MNYKNPQEALKAQAVTARSYTVTNRNRHASYGFDLCSSTHCQLYSGYSGEYSETISAVDETAGLAMYYEGKAVSGYYFKNSGGQTQSSHDVWNSSIGYLVGKADEYSPVYTWNASFTFAELESKLNAAGKSVGTLESVVISKRDASGAVAELKFVGSSGTTTFTKENIRIFLGATLLKSTIFSFDKAAIAGNSESGNKASASTFAYSGSVKTPLNETVYVIGSDKSVSSVKSKGLYASSGASPVLLAEDKHTTSGLGTETVTASPLEISGVGYGHGVGMPQDSAIEMAKQGFTFDAILKYYYTGIEVR